MQMRNKTKCLFLFGVILFNTTLPAQSMEDIDPELVNWYNKDYEEDNVVGVSVDKAYRELLANKKPKKVIIVAVLDSGVDTAHVDLDGRYWINENEIPYNGIDDDNNGYVDDKYGWNYLGNADGENIEDETLEMTRIVGKYEDQFESKEMDTIALEGLELQEYNDYKRAKAAYDEMLDKRKKTRENLDRFNAYYNKCKSVLQQKTGIIVKNKDDLKPLSKSTDQDVNRAARFLYSIYDDGFSDEELKEEIDRSDLFLKKHLNVKYNPRAEIIKDNPESAVYTGYGNPNVQGPKADHGTPISGIIAGLRNNDEGINGIAESVKIMALRTTPNGDERDKDVALAIRYAADNGANIINMSFGKDFSPQKQMVDDAMKYALSKGVLFIHSAGNDGKDLDENPSFPSNHYLSGEVIPAYITVGANNKDRNKYLPSVFSNYGEKEVHIFAPGERVVSTETGNAYKVIDGTSFSGPVVTGVAALVWSYYPELTAAELTQVLISTAEVITKPRKVRQPLLTGEKRPKTKFSELSVSGGVVNAYNALFALQQEENKAIDTQSVDE